MAKDNRTAARAAILGLSLAGLASCGGCGSGGGTGPQTPREACDALAKKTFGEATIDSATLVPQAGATVEHCKVAGTIRTSLKFAATLPTTWNKKLLYTGGGGWDGSIPDLTLSASGTTAGYVTVASNGGHSDPSGAVFLNNPQVQKDFGYLSIHTVLEAVKQVVQKRYGSDAERAYFEGCSNGGREALIQATRYPADFDGIVARAPAYSFTELVLAFHNNVKRMLLAPGGAISVAKAKSIAAAVVRDCDALDGVSDGVVSNVAACAFDPNKLLCPAADSDACLTAEQVTTARTIYSEFKLPDGTSVYPGWGPGGEDEGWPPWLIGDAMTPSAQLFFADSLIRFWIMQDATFNSLLFDPSKYRAKIAEVAQTLDASPDLKAFFARKGRLILVHGTSDWAISYKGSIKYWDNVATAVGGAAVRDESMEFFLQPGVQHCFGGAGPDTVDLLSAVSKWVEEGQRPSGAGLTLRKADPASMPTGIIERPLCPYPKYPRYSGTGSEKAASSYTCVNP